MTTSVSSACKAESPWIMIQKHHKGNNQSIRNYDKTPNEQQSEDQIKSKPVEHNKNHTGYLISHKPHQTHEI